MSSLNQIPNNPTLKDVLDLLKKDILLTANCHHVGSIAEFDAAAQTARVSIVYRKSFSRPGPDGVYRIVLEDYPVAVDCPVIFVGGGNGALTFPVAKGDECLVLFNDRDIDAWFQGNQGAETPTARLHSFADAIVLVGLRSRPNVVTDFVDDRTELRTKDGKCRVSIGDDDIMLIIASGETPVINFTVNDAGKLSATNASGELVTALSAMYTAIQSGTAGGYPLLLPPDYATNLTILQSFKV